MPLAKASMLLLTVLIVEIQAQWTSDDSGTYLGQTGLQQRNQIHSLRNLGLRQQLRTIPLQFTTASRRSLLNIPTVDTELVGPNEGIGHNSNEHSHNIVDPELLGPNEGIGHDDHFQFTNVLSDIHEVSSGSVIERAEPPVSPYLIPGRISPFRGPKGEIFRITGEAALPPIVPNRFNRLPELGGSGDAVTSSGEYIYTLDPPPRRQRGQFGIEI
ncbi:hypothetical protein ACJMK2_034073 [Sinanodonta woodiana]|uniref:Uncharacterized protein n=1 Tax=Sinanodonta woodiana TaxID=1069815 RepID=A0ABD3WTX3_SINWO